MDKEYEGKIQDIASSGSLENFYQKFVLPEFGIDGDIRWERHVKTNPDNFLHLFSAGGIRYALGFDDYPSGFSVGSDTSVKALRLSNGEKILHVSTQNKYIENVTGSFMLFQIIDEAEFDALVVYREAAYARQRREWDEAKGTVMIARDVLQLAETASQNHDAAALYSLRNIARAFLALDVNDNNLDLRLLAKYMEILVDAEFGYELFSNEEKERVASKIYKTFAEDLQNALTIRKYEVGHLGAMIKLVSAMYSRTEADMTEGISIVLTCENDKISYPNEHFINGELKKYFAENPYITGQNVERHLPGELGKYRLVAGSEHSEYIFKRELDYVGF